MNLRPETIYSRRLQITITLDHPCPSQHQRSLFVKHTLLETSCSRAWTLLNKQHNKKHGNVSPWLITQNNINEWNLTNWFPFSCLVNITNMCTNLNLLFCQSSLGHHILNHLRCLASAAVCHALVPVGI